MARSKSCKKTSNCNNAFHDDVCCPEKYSYDFKYACEATPCDFRIWREKNECPCCPKPYKYQYTVRVKCLPTNCENESSTTSTPTETFPSSFSTSSSSTTVEITHHHHDKRRHRK